MFSRGFASAVSLLRASQLRVFTASMQRGLYTRLNDLSGRTPRPVSSVLCRHMSNEEKRSTAESVQKIKKPLTLSEMNDTGKKGSKLWAVLNGIGRAARWLNIISNIIVTGVCLWVLKILEEPHVMRFIAVAEDTYAMLTGNNTTSANTDERSDREN